VSDRWKWFAIGTILVWSWIAPGDGLGADGLGTDGLGTDRLSADRLGTDRLGTDRLGAAPKSLSGQYATDSELMISPEFGAGTPQVFPLELRMNLTDADRSLRGGLIASTKGTPLSFSFALTGERRDPAVRLRLEVGVCLERPTVTLEATLRGDGSIEVPASSQVITCNFGRMRLALPRATRFVPEPGGP
jgi:hypothetical protein